MTKKMQLNFSTGQKLRANLRTQVNASKIVSEVRNGRDVIVVPSFTLPDDIVMNGIKYPAEEIRKSFKTLQGTPAPLGHPMDADTGFVPASSPLGLNLGYFGAWNDNVVQVSGRVFMEKVIDVKRANESDMGKRVLAAIAAGDPVHTSTGLLMNVRECADEGIDWEGYDMEFDHDAILLDEEGAGTPAQGVGMLVNGKKLMVVNGTIETDFEQELEWAAEQVARAVERAEEREEDKPLVQSIKAAILKALGLERETVTEEGISVMDANDQKLFDDLNAKVDKLAETNHEEAITTAVNAAIAPLAAAIAPLTDFVNAQSAASAVEHEALVAEAVKAELLSEADAKATPLNALKALVNSATKSKATPAPGIGGAFNHKASEADSLAEDWEK